MRHPEDALNTFAAGPIVFGEGQRSGLKSRWTKGAKRPHSGAHDFCARFRSANSYEVFVFGNGVSGMSTPRKEQCGGQPSATSSVSERSAGNIASTSAMCASNTRMAWSRGTSIRARSKRGSGVWCWARGRSLV